MLLPSGFHSLVYVILSYPPARQLRFSNSGLSTSALSLFPLIGCLLCCSTDLYFWLGTFFSAAILEAKLTLSHSSSLSPLPFSSPVRSFFQEYFSLTPSLSLSTSPLPLWVSPTRFVEVTFLRYDLLVCERGPNLLISAAFLSSPARTEERERESERAASNVRSSFPTVFIVLSLARLYPASSLLLFP